MKLRESVDVLKVELKVVVAAGFRKPNTRFQ